TSGGYFAQFFNPPSTLTPMSKHVIFVLSFFNHLLEAWDAVSAILEGLEHSDFLTIVYHERGVPKLWGTNRCTESSMEHSLSAIVPASHDNKVRAKAFLRTGIDLYEGSTIPGLLTALDLAEISITNHSNRLRLNLFPVIVHLAEKHDHTSVDNQKEHDDALITSVSSKNLRHRVPIYNLVL
ncbi:unnamed protein product, partial [Timema podura]|nr:unnamed protein product [Timema podura]